ncbi:uncharacterized protein LOC121405295 [Drosophila obscura]|uniref:uncharacterized protein LOC121405295 n=1 Tax=Drosophila obscura TaxID=7282 RepID=UPI001BB1B1B3|nr:uncharacterized protein LOC121405295 [Drosophila obscura]
MGKFQPVEGAGDRAFNLDGSNFQFLYLKVVSVHTDVLGKDAIDAGQQHVLHSIRRAGLARIECAKKHKIVTRCTACISVLRTGKTPINRRCWRTLMDASRLRRIPSGAFSTAPFTTLESLNSTNLELCGRVIVNLVVEVQERHGAAVMQPAPVRFMARIVGVAELLTLKPNSVRE